MFTFLSPDVDPAGYHGVVGETLKISKLMTLGTKLAGRKLKAVLNDSGPLKKEIAKKDTIFGCNLPVTLINIQVIFN